MIEKQCIHCGKTFPATSKFFPKHPGHKDGLRNSCKTCRSEFYRKWRQEHADYKAEQDRQYHAAHPQAVKKANQKYYQQHKSEYRERARQWRKKNPAKAQTLVHKRNHRVLSLPNTLTPQEWENILLYYNHSCAYCGVHQRKLAQNLAQEHVIPVKRGGGLTKDNIVPACKSCNSKKGAHPPEEVGMLLIKPIHVQTTSPGTR